MARKVAKQSSVTALVTPDLFETGCGRLLGARYKSDGRVEVGVIFLDVHCLGVVDAVFHVLSEAEFEEHLREEAEKIGESREMDPACARKLVEDAVAFARQFGFSPHRHLKQAMRVFGGIRAADCEEEFEFGLHGKAHYVQGHDEPDAKAARVVLQLYRHCGWDGFHYTIAAEAADTVRRLCADLGIPMEEGSKSSGTETAGPFEGMAPFINEFPQLGADETRFLLLQTHEDDLPPGKYGFMEFYCMKPSCDCRRVVLQVRSEERPETVLATINYGWESEDFYAEWVGDAEEADGMAGATLDPLNPQSKHSNTLLDLFENVVLKDTDYIARLERHYRMFRERVQSREKRKDPRPRRSRSKQESTLDKYLPSQNDRLKLR